MRDPLTVSALLVYRVVVSSKPIETSRTIVFDGSIIERDADVLTFVLKNIEHGNEVTGVMFDAMLAELRAEATRPSARGLRIRAHAKGFCTGRERAGRDSGAIRKEAARLIECKRALRTSPWISIEEVQSDAFGCV